MERDALHLVLRLDRRAIVSLDGPMLLTPCVPCRAFNRQRFQCFEYPALQCWTVAEQLSLPHTLLVRRLAVVCVFRSPMSRLALLLLELDALLPLILLICANLRNVGVPAF